MEPVTDGAGEACSRMTVRTLATRDPTAYLLGWNEQDGRLTWAGIRLEEKEHVGSSRGEV